MTQHHATKQTGTSTERQARASTHARLLGLSLLLNDNRLRRRLAILLLLRRVVAAVTTVSAVLVVSLLGSAVATLGWVASLVVATAVSGALVVSLVVSSGWALVVALVVSSGRTLVVALVGWRALGSRGFPLGPTRGLIDIVVSVGLS